jgi:hypothetical protein
MNQPMSIDDVPYYTGYYNGDFIITNGVLYYFPHTDLTQEDINNRVGSRTPFVARILINGVSTVVFSAAYITKLSGSNRSRIRKAGLWKANDSNADLQKRLDEHISKVKSERSAGVKFSTALPAPERFARDEIQNMKLSFGGVLTFDAHSDSHDFKVGLIRKGLLRQALKDGGFPIEG